MARPHNNWALVRHLGEDQPIYALQAVGLEGDAAVAITIEEMARQFLAEVRTVQKTGPYYLGGYCLGGLTAYEMARQLIEQNEKVNLLFLISTRTPQNIKASWSQASLSDRLMGRIG